MIIKSIKFLKHIQPNRSCGTGYSEPDEFEVETTRGIKFNIYIDTWYVNDENKIHNIFVKSLKKPIQEGIIENIEEAYDMYINELKNK